LILAYVLAKVEAGKDREALKKIKTINGVKKARATYGTYDLVVEVSFDSIEELDEFVFDRLRKIQQVKETVTVICSETMS
jgi:DNA-binding Lrp family transcriptional regulator